MTLLLALAICVAILPRSTVVCVKVRGQRGRPRLSVEEGPGYEPVVVQPVDETSTAHRQWCSCLVLDQFSSSARDLSILPREKPLPEKKDGLGNFYP